MPVGEEPLSQTLCKITRRGRSEFVGENLGAVAFVPLIGEQGWAEDGRRSVNDQLSGHSR